jgi:hypothetical protein
VKSRHREIEDHEYMFSRGSEGGELLGIPRHIDHIRQRNGRTRVPRGLKEIRRCSGLWIVATISRSFQRSRNDDLVG